MADDAALHIYLWKSEGALFALAAAHSRSRAAARTWRRPLRACGHAYGLARLLLGLPHALSRGRLLLPQSRLDAAE